MAFLRRLRRTLWFGTLAYAAAALIVGMLRADLDLPWTPLDLRHPIGPATLFKLADLAGDGARCRAVLAQAGIAFRAVPPRGPACAVDDGVNWTRGGTRTLGYRPAAPLLACPLAAALTMWEWHVVQPAAARLLRARVVAVEHYGSFACRRVYGRTEGPWSEHARAAAIDIAGFRLADGRRVTVARDWARDAAEGHFLHAVRDGGCRLFATTLSPDYNAAHRDHLHLDAAARGGWSSCR